MSDAFRLVLNGPAFGDLANGDWLLQEMLRLTDLVVDVARDTVPRHTGAGAMSINNEADLGTDGWEIFVGWDAAHQYMASLHSHALQDALATVAIETSRR